MTFNVGDPVMHWTYGLGHVLGLEERTLSGHKVLYYAVKVRDMTVWVPDDDSIGRRLRPPSTKHGFKRLLAILSGPAEPLPEDRQERKLQLVERLKDGKPESLCHVIRDLATFQHTRSLNDNDQSLMRRAREALVSEWGFALSVQPAQAEADLHRLLTTSAPIA